MIPRACLLWMLSFLLWMQGSSPAADPLRVMSFNIRYGAANDGANHWDHRKDLVVDVIQQFAPDLLGLQESLDFQSAYLVSQLGAYDYFGRSRMNTPNEHCGILFSRDRFVQLAGGHFWLSESPEVPQSKSWDSSLPRMATWLLLHDNQQPAGPPVLIVNTHFDHLGEMARRASAELLGKRVERLRGLATDPLVIITGDFNTGESSGPYQVLMGPDAALRDSYRVVHPQPASEEGTFNHWSGATDGTRIDWILVGGPVRVQSAEIVRTSRGGHYPSDHYPVTAILEPTATDGR
jgi:endonuclease/exonuclease/phosphatase family metal-dependent hydrolase